MKKKKEGDDVLSSEKISAAVMEVFTKNPGKNYNPRQLAEQIRKSRSVCDCHSPGAFTSFSCSNMKLPFLALAKVPSMKHSDISIFPRVFKSSASAFNILFHTPALFHL